MLVLPSEIHAAANMTSLRAIDGNTSCNSCESFSLHFNIPLIWSQGYSTMKITGNAIVTPGVGPSGAAHRTPLSKTSSFTMLDPTSFGDYTPRLRASVTSRTHNSQVVHQRSFIG